DTPIDVASLRKLLSDLTVEEATYELEDGPHSVIKVSRGGTALFSIEHEDGKLDSIEILSREIKSDTGLVVGQTFPRALAALGRGAECYGMMEEDGGSALCHAPGAWTYAVQVPMHDDDAKYYGKKVPAKKFKGVFAGQTVERVIWSPAAAAK